MTTEIRDLLETRLAVLKDEAGRLERALEALGPARTQPRRAATTARGSSKSPRRYKRKRAPRGERQRQMIEAIQKMPGATPLELADSIGVRSTQGHGLIRSLEGKGKIKKKGQGFEVIG